MQLNGHLRLDVPFDEKEQAVQLGAKPHVKDGRFQFWYAHKYTDIMPFLRWWNADFVQAVMAGTLDVPSEQLAAAQAALSQQSAPMAMPSAPSAAPTPSAAPDEGHKGASLSGYLKEVRRVVGQSFSSASWVMADVVNITGRPGSHRYLELAEYDASGREVAKTRGMLWAKKANLLLPRFETATGMPLAQGMKVLVQVRAEVSERYGLSLQIDNIDPRFTLGELEAKIQRIRQQLQQEGWQTQYQRIGLPGCFRRVAVIAPEGAAGLGDFNTQADVLQRIGLCQFELFPAYFQGDHAKRTIAEAFARIAECQQQGADFDAIVIIRGGGDTAGLMALNEYEIVRAICAATLPVMVGIGHERDVTLLDEYGAMRFATPSMVVGHITRSWVEHGEAVRTLQHQMQQCVGDILVRVREQLNRYQQSVDELLSSEVRRTRERLAQVREQVYRDNLNSLGQLRHVLNAVRHEVAGVSPARILAQGYGYVIEAPGKTLPSVAMLAEHSTATLRMRDGDITIYLKKSEGA